MLRVRTGFECPEDNLKELTRDSNPNCGIAKEEKKKKERERENFPVKGSNLRYSLACSQNKALNNHQRKVGWLWTGPSPPEGREAGMRQPEPEGEGPSQPQSQHPPKTVSRLPVANHDFLGSWMVEFCQEERHMAHLRWCSCGAPRKPRCQDQGGD